MSVAADLRGLMAYLDQQGYGHTVLEHAIDERLLRHESWLTVPTYTAFPRLVLFHPVNCGCDALTNELVLHG